MSVKLSFGFNDFFELLFFFQGGMIEQHKSLLTLGG